MSTFNAPSDIAAATRALSSHVNDLKTATEDAFDLLPDEDDLFFGLAQYGTSGGSADAYTFLSNKTQTAYSDGMEIVFKAAATNLTTTPTINVDSLGAKTITRRDGSAISAGEIVINKFTVLRYNSTADKMEIMNAVNLSLLQSIESDLSDLRTEVQNARDGEATLLAQIDDLQSLISTVTTEVENARDGESNLKAQIDSIQLLVSTVTTEVTNARDGETNLLAQIDSLQSLVSTVTTEVTNARDGEANLFAQIDDIQANIAAVVLEVINARDGESTLLDQIDALQADIALLGEAELPGQTGNSGKFLTTDGSASSWDDVADDTAYDATSWDGNTDAATKNAIRDEFENKADKSSIQRGNSTFNSTTGQTISINTVADTDYHVTIEQRAASGYVGEVTIKTKATNSFVVENSGSDDSTAFGWVLNKI